MNDFTIYQRVKVAEVKLYSTLGSKRIQGTISSIAFLFLCVRSEISLFYYAGSCRTRSSTGNCCVFPFIYRGKRYSRCTRVRSKRPWCALTPSYDKDKLYGYCGGRKRKKTNSFLFTRLPFSSQLERVFSLVREKKADSHFKRCQETNSAASCSCSFGFQSHTQNNDRSREGSKKEGLRGPEPIHCPYHHHHHHISLPFKPCFSLDFERIKCIRRNT